MGLRAACRWASRPLCRRWASGPLCRPSSPHKWVVSRRVVFEEARRGSDDVLGSDLLRIEAGPELLARHLLAPSFARVELTRELCDEADDALGASSRLPELLEAAGLISFREALSARIADEWDVKRGGLGQAERPLQ